MAKLPDRVPAPAMALLNFIGRTEAPEGYDTIFGNRQGKLPTPVTQMTLGDLIDAQGNWGSKPWVKEHWGYSEASSAAGRYQFMRRTLQDICREVAFELRGDMLFDAELQDRLGYYLLLRRGYAEFMAGKIRVTEFGLRLAQEWASFPVLAPMQGQHRAVKRGQSYYAGDGVNKALVAPEEVEYVLLDLGGIRNSDAPIPETVIVEKPVVADPGELEKHPARSKTVWTWALAGLGALVSAVGEFMGGLDWRAQMIISAGIIGFAVYGIKRRNDLFNAVRDLKAEISGDA